MTRIWTLLGLLWLATLARADQAALERFDRANRAYEAGDFRTAVALYDSLAGAGFGGLELWYNKGNSHYRLGETGPAILCWRRAEAVAPFDRDVQKNLEIAARLVQDDLGEAVRLPLWDHLDRLLEAVPRNLTALLLLGAVALWSGLTCLRILGRFEGRAVLPVFQGLSGGTALALLALLALQVRHHESGRQLVIQADRVSVSAAPLADGEALFDLHAGTTVRLVSESPEWWRLALPDGREGWVPRNAAEVVELQP